MIVATSLLLINLVSVQRSNTIKFANNKLMSLATTQKLLLKKYDTHP